MLAAAAALAYSSSEDAPGHGRLVPASQDQLHSLPVNGRSIQLGNAISAWWFASQPELEPHLRKCSRYFALNSGTFSAAHQCESERSMCFGKWLMSRMDVGVTPLPQHTRVAVGKLLRSEALQGVNGDMAQDGCTALYSTDVVALCASIMGSDLRKMLKRYAKQHDRRLLSPPGPRKCIVHYRVGDFLSFTQVPAPRSVAEAIASFDPPPTSVELLSVGGQHFPDWNSGNSTDPNTSDAETDSISAVSLQLIHQLLRNVRELLPNATVRQAPARPPDEDFYRMALAPMLVVGVGSFGISGALSATGRVRSPAAKNLYQPWPDQPVRTVRPGWTTYNFDAWHTGWQKLHAIANKH